MLVLPTNITNKAGGPVATTLLSFHVKHQWFPAAAVQRAAQLPAARIISTVRRIPGVLGCAALLTCQRSELYVEATTDPDVRQRLRGFFQGAAFHAVVEDAPVAMRPTTPLQEKEGAETIHHLFRVSAGLESLLIGESEIVGQVRRAFNQSLELSAMSRGLSRLFQTSLELGRIARTQPGYSLRRHSYVEESLEFVNEKLLGTAGRSYAIVGAGPIGSRFAHGLARAGASSIFLLNRSAPNARKAIGGSGATYRPLSRLEETLRVVDAAFFAVSGGGLLHDTKTSPPNLKVIVDLCDVPAVRTSKPEPPVLNLDQVITRLAQKHRPTANVVERVTQMVAGAANLYFETHQAPSQRALRALGEFAQTVEETELQKARRKLRHLSPADLATVETLARSLRSKLLAGPTMALRTSSQPQPILQLFGLEPDRDAS